MKKVFTVEEIKRKLEQYCVYQDRCHKEVETKLREYRLIPEARELILLHLLEHNFLNEERFSRSFARGKFRIKKWGKERIQRELKLRNISPYNIRKSLEEIEDEVYLETLQLLLQKKNTEITKGTIYERKRKVFDFLKYRGYETNLILEYLEDIK